MCRGPLYIYLSSRFIRRGVYYYIAVSGVLSQNGMGQDRMGWEGAGQEGAGWDGTGQGGTRWDRAGKDRMGRGGTGQDWVG